MEKNKKFKKKEIEVKEKISKVKEISKKEVPEVALRKGFSVSDNILSTLVTRSSGRSSSSLKKEIKEIIKEDETLEEVVEDSQGFGLDAGLSKGDIYQSSSRGDVNSEGGDSKNMYDAGFKKDESFYETGHVDVPRDISEGFYEGRLKIDPSERSWAIDTHWGINPLDNERSISGGKLINPRDQIKGEAFAGPGEQDGYSK